MSANFDFVAKIETVVKKDEITWHYDNFILRV